MIGAPNARAGDSARDGVIGAYEVSGVNDMKIIHWTYANKKS